MRILIVSKEVWRNDQNGGNTLTWMFSDFPVGTEFAQIYCSEGRPNNRVCNNYYKLSTRDVVKAIRYSDIEAGEIFNQDIEQDNISPIEVSRQSLFNGVTNNESLRDFVWKTGKFKSEKLKKYIIDYNPDIIYSPGYGVNYMNYLIQWIDSFMDCPIVTLISDDYYSFKQKRLNPLFWMYLLGLRKNIRKSVKCYDLIYTMTDMQKIQLEKDFGVSVRIIQKGYYFDDEMIKNKTDSKPIRIIHVGNVYHNRWKTLCMVGDCINRINGDEKEMQLEIVTSYAMSDKLRKEIESRNIVIHTNVSEKELKDLYKSCDVVLHVESFDLINRLKMMMSFSTKIIEYLASGCAIMAICDKKQSTYQFLQKNDMAICIDSLTKVENELLNLCNNRSIIKEKQGKAFEYGKKNHSIEIVSGTLYRDFSRLICE